MGLKIRRTEQAILTAEGATLKHLRLKSGLSMREAGLSIGKSDSYISHIETGRLDIPKEEILEKLLGGYGVFNVGDFKKKVFNYKQRSFKKKRITNLIKKLSNEKLDFLIKVLSQ